MSEVPVIVVSSPFPCCGKTTLALNLAAALWSDGYEVDLIAPQNELVERFLRQRRKLQETRKLDLYVPTLLSAVPLQPKSEKYIVIAIIPAENFQQYAAIFNQAHTLVTVVPSILSAFWNAADGYLGMIWNAKKHIAARGIKAANWVVVPYLENPTVTDGMHGLLEASRRYGFRVAEILPYRDAYNHVKEGYCAADMRQYNSVLNMAFADVYARREILQLTDFFWKK